MPADNPYDFVPIPKRGPADQEATAEPIAPAYEPVFHDGDNDEPVYSGELRCTLEALTPLIVANDQYEVSEIDPSQDFRRHWGITQTLSGKKKIIEPLRLADGRVAISPTSLKGMLRQSIG